AQANKLATRGRLQSEIARTLGVSVMTLHRWRKAPPGSQPASRELDRTRGANGRIAELQLENARLRRLGTDLLLGKVQLEEAAQSQSFRRMKERDEHSDNDPVYRSARLWTHSIKHVRWFKPAE